MSTSPSELANLVLEQLRLMRAETSAMRAETSARFDRMEARFDEVGARFTKIERELRGLKLNTIAEVYKANLTVASFADHERRLQALGSKSG
jgi:hypothetical protein